MPIDLSTIYNSFGKIDINLKIVFFLTFLTFIPFFLIATTCFTRIVIVLSLLRQAMGVPQVPPTPVIISLSLFLTLFTMKPVIDDIEKNALTPYLEKKIDDVEFIKRSIKPLKKFMLRNTRKDDLALFLSIANIKLKTVTPDTVPMLVLIPAYMISEIRTALEIVFLIYLPFFVIDVIVATILMAMGMMMIPPMMISLPFKILLLVLSNGLEYLIRALIETYK